MSTVIEAPRALRSARAVRKVSVAWYWIALGVVVAGVVLAILWGVKSVDRANEQAAAFSRTPLPGSVTVGASEQGDKMIYYAGQGTATVDSLGLQVTDPSGVAIPVMPYDRASEVELTGDVGTAIATFASHDTGLYTVTASGMEGPDGSIVIGDNVSAQAVPPVLGALALILVSIVVAATIVFVTLVRRTQGV